MNFLNRIKEKYIILICLFLFFIISICSIYSANTYMNIENIIIKQLIFYIIGFILIFIISMIDIKLFYKYSFYLYIIGIVLLILVLIFGSTINGTKCWFKIPGIGNIQPSEYMKIILILFLSKIINESKKNTLLDEFKLILKVIFITFIPSILTFLEPDTGAVIIYLIIMITMLFISQIRYRWFIIFFMFIISIISFILITYFNNSSLFIKLFGSSFFLRINRLLDFANGSGYQFTSGITAIGSGGLIGYGFNNTPIYFPEAQTDFIFAVYSNNFGFIGSLLLITIIVIFDINIIKIAIKSKSINKLLIGGFLGMIIYQQFQNIGMTIGLMPITGITLPFISYGGSSLISYMIILGIILNIEKRA